MKTNRLEQLLDLLKEQPNDSFLFFAIAKEYEKSEAYPEALDWFTQLRSIDPGYTGLYFHLGKLEEKLGHTAAARAVYEDGIRICRQAGDQHALSELQGALMNMDIA